MFGVSSRSIPIVCSNAKRNAPPNDMTHRLEITTFIDFISVTLLSSNSTRIQQDIFSLCGYTIYVKDYMSSRNM